MFSGRVHFNWGEERESIVHSEYIGAIDKRRHGENENDIKLDIYNIQGVRIYSLVGEIAQSYWQQELNLCHTSFSDEPEY